MLFLVTPTFYSNFLSQLYATINTVESNVAGTMGTVLEQGKLNDEIIKIFKKIFPNPNIVFKRLKETEFYTISLAKQSDIDFAELEKKHVINSSLHNNLTNPALTLRFIDSASGQDSTMGINKILFNLSTTMPNYTPFTDKELYENEGAKIQEMIQNGKKLSGIKLNNLNLNNTNYPGVSFSGSDDMNDSQFVNAKLIGADFADAELNNADFNKADLRGSEFPVATITGKASFVGADLKFSNFSGADLTGADLSDADFRHTNLSATTLTDCIINENTKIYGAKLDDAIYDENLNEANRQQYEDDIEYEEYIRLLQGPDGEEEEWEQEGEYESEAQEDDADMEPDEVEVAEVEDDESLDDEAVEGDKNICFDYIYGDDKNILKYLQKNPLNLVIKKTNGEFECESLSSLRKQYKNERSGKYKYYGYYECSKELMDKVKETGTTPMDFGINDYDSTKEYVKIGSALSYIEKPDWIYDGPPAEPRIYELVSTGEKKYLVEKSLTKSGANVVSGIHCDLNDYFEIFKLVPIQLEGNMSGGNKSHKKTYNKKMHKKTHKKTQKKTQKKTHKKTQKKTQKKTHKKTYKKTYNKKTHKKKTHKKKTHKKKTHKK
jgi:uncharacterized protein YjbI with pentapeptide repeats